MTISTLFICQSCRLSDPEDQDKPADGTMLLNQLLTLHQRWSQRDELEIQPVGCLWTCNQPCAVALQGANKCTYLFTHLPLLDSADALIQFGELYLNSEDGNIPWKKIPDVLKGETIARIPAAGQ